MLHPDVVDVWLISLDAVAPGGHDDRVDELSPYEQHRLWRLGQRNPRARHRYLATHLAVREIVAGYLGCHPGELTHVRNAPHGKPGYNLGWCPGPAVSLSRSDGLALLGVRPPGATVGVDVERIRAGIDWPRVLGRRAVGTVPGFRAWTRLEASVKASGLGLAAGAGRDLSPWPAATLALPHPFRDYAAAVATEQRQKPVDIRFRHHSGALGRPSEERALAQVGSW
ncbi:4'-phosphopantetheinyl transferase family protein [Streptomyces sp. NPDC053493]|uniref:4'-phosphopantetheinyl transferase family protein n=1 Tax=Streptomyces sp. NPDC053493 TaxID=3365705 RepID=UPI0037D78A04